MLLDEDTNRSSRKTSTLENREWRNKFCGETFFVSPYICQAWFYNFDMNKRLTVLQICVFSSHSQTCHSIGRPWSIFKSGRTVDPSWWNATCFSFFPFLPDLFCKVYWAAFFIATNHAYDGSRSLLFDCFYEIASCSCTEVLRKSIALIHTKWSVAPQQCLLVLKISSSFFKVKSSLQHIWKIDYRYKITIN